MPDHYAPSSYLARHELSGRELSNYNYSIPDNSNANKEEALLLFQEEKTTVVLLSPLMCLSGECITSKPGEYFYAFGGHLSPNGSRWLGNSYNCTEQVLSD
jgi:hypothetical protein